MNPVHLNALLYSLEPNVFLSSTQALTAVFRFEGMPCYGQSEAEYTHLMVGLMDVLNQVDTRCDISFMTRNCRDTTSVDHFLSKMTYSDDRESYIKTSFNDIRKIHSYLYLSLPIESWGFSLIGSVSKIAKPVKARLDLLKKESKALEDGLKTLGFYIEKASLNEVGRLSYEQWNGEDADDLMIHTDPIHLIVNKQLCKCVPTIREQTCHHPIHIHQRCIQINHRFYATLSMELPPLFSDLMLYQHLHELLNHTDHKLLITCKRLKKDRFVNQLINRQKDMHATSHIHSRVEDHYTLQKPGSAKSILQDQIAIMDDLSSLPLEAFRFSFALCFSESSEQALEKTVQSVKKKIHTATFSHMVVRERGAITPYLFAAFIPGNSHQCVDYVCGTTLQLIFFLPINRYYKGSLVSGKTTKTSA